MRSCSRIIAILAYNESQHIALVLQELQLALKQDDIFAEIFVLDDCSSDNTRLIAEQSGIANVLTTDARLGYWQNVARAINLAVSLDSQELILFDGDGQHDPTNIKKIVHQLSQGSDLVIVNRFRSSVEYKMDLLKSLGRQFYRGLIYLLAGFKCCDPTSGNIGLSKIALCQLSKSNRLDLLMDAALLTWACLTRLKTNEVTGIFHPNKRSKLYRNPIYAFATFCHVVLVTLQVWIRIAIRRGRCWQN